jgi:hypothetical protein
MPDWYFFLLQGIMILADGGVFVFYVLQLLVHLKVAAERKKYTDSQRAYHEARIKREAAEFNIAVVSPRSSFSRGRGSSRSSFLAAPVIAPPTVGRLQYYLVRAGVATGIIKLVNDVDPFEQNGILGNDASTFIFRFTSIGVLTMVSIVVYILTDLRYSTRMEEMPLVPKIWIYFVTVLVDLTLVGTSIAESIYEPYTAITGSLYLTMAFYMYSMVVVFFVCSYSLELKITEFARSFAHTPLAGVQEQNLQKTCEAAIKKELNETAIPEEAPAVRPVASAKPTTKRKSVSLSEPDPAPTPSIVTDLVVVAQQGAQVSSTPGQEASPAAPPSAAEASYMENIKTLYDNTVFKQWVERDIETKQPLYDRKENSVNEEEKASPPHSQLELVPTVSSSPVPPDACAAADTLDTAPQSLSSRSTSRKLLVNTTEDADREQESSVGPGRNAQSPMEVLRESSFSASRNSASGSPVARRTSSESRQRQQKQKQRQTTFTQQTATRASTSVAGPAYPRSRYVSAANFSFKNIMHLFRLAGGGWMLVGLVCASALMYFGVPYVMYPQPLLLGADSSFTEIASTMVFDLSQAAFMGIAVWYTYMPLKLIFTAAYPKRYYELFSEDRTDSA